MSLDLEPVNQTSRPEDRFTRRSMKKFNEYVLGRLIAGALVVAPIYLAVLLLLKGMKSLTGVLKPFAHLLPNWLPAGEVLSLLIVVCVSSKESLEEWCNPTADHPLALGDCNDLK